MYLSTNHSSIKQSTHVICIDLFVRTISFYRRITTSVDINEILSLLNAAGAHCDKPMDNVMRASPVMETISLRM